MATYEIEVLKKNSKDIWLLWETVKENPTKEYLKTEINTPYCKMHFAKIRVIRVERTALHEKTVEN